MREGALGNTEVAVVVDCAAVDDSPPETEALLSKVLLLTDRVPALWIAAPWAFFPKLVPLMNFKFLRPSDEFTWKSWDLLLPSNVMAACEVLASRITP